MQIESNQSKLSLGWLPPLHSLWIWDQYFIPDILFHGVCATFASPLSSAHCVFNVEFMLLCFLILFFFFSCQCVAADKQGACLQKGEVSFPVEWIDRFVRRKRWIISAVAKGCHEVVWHRHWLSLLRSEGIVGLSWERKRETKGEGVSRRTDKTANWIGWDASVLWVCCRWCNMLFRLDQQSVVLAWLRTIRCRREGISRSQMNKGRRHRG